MKRLLLIALVGLACTEPRTPQTVMTPAQPLSARLELSDSAATAGSRITLALRVVGDDHEHVASFTTRVSYDSLGLRFVRETSPADGAMRVSNPTAGLVRTAGVLAQGFGDRVLASYELEVVNPAALRTLRLSVDELHTTGNADLSRRVGTGPTVVRR